MKILCINILVFLVLILAFGVISFWLLPAGYVSRFREYRADPLAEGWG